MKKFFKEFKEFAMRGSVIDLAVGVIIGGAFQKIVTSLVNDIISPLIGLIANKDFTALVAKIGDVEIKYGAFVTEVINFILMAFVIFLIIKILNALSSMRKKEEIVEEPTTQKCPFCCSEIDINATKCPNCTSDIAK